MFENIDNNKKMIIGAYKKLKSYYYYDKTILYNKMRLAMWESNANEMEERVTKLAYFMTSLENEVDNHYLNMLIRNVAMVPMPKAFESSEQEDCSALLQNTVKKNRPLSKINFYIKAPVELLILDTIWMLMISKIADHQSSIMRASYANKLKSRQLFTGGNDDLFAGIEFDSNRLFVPYFKQYTSWRDSAFKRIRSRYDEKQDSVLISLDIKSYYYSVIFSFDKLPNYLDHDERLNTLRPLTKIIERLYIAYTAEMQKYRGAIPADCKKGQCAFPIGLLSSMVLANLYLQDFDHVIEDRIKPEYYGRYVDDILIVVDKTPDMEISVDNILKKTLVENKIVEPKTNDEYKVLVSNGLKLQSSKIRCIYFDHNEPDALIKLLCEASNLKPSMSDGTLMPDIDISEKSFDEQAYSLGQQDGALKVRNFLFSTNNYQATLFINDLIRSSKNVDVGEEKHRKYIAEQLKQILRFYNSSQAIEYRSAWINVFSLILVNERYDYFLNFYSQIKTSISSLSAGKVELIEPSKTEAITNQIKNALKEQLMLAASIAIAPLAQAKAKSEIDKINEENGNVIDSSEQNEIFQNAQDIRNANMFNNHFLSFPLISYIVEKDNSETSLIKANPQDIVQLGSNYSGLLPLNERKVSLSPRFIHFDELCLLSFLVHFPEGGNPFVGRINDLMDAFSRINNLHHIINSIENDMTDPASGISFQCISAPAADPDFTHGSLKIALASINLDEGKDIEPVIDDSSYDLSPVKKRNLYKLLNRALESHANMIVFPEYYLPIDWLEEVYTFSRKNSITIVSGLRYITNNTRAFNFVTVLQPFSVNKFKYSAPLIREKNHYAPDEVTALAHHHFECEDPKCPSIHLITWNGVSYSDLMCFELTNIDYRYVLRGKIEVLIIPELNRDTLYFSNIVESTSRDLYCFVIQANTSKYGDSRITGPYNSLFKDIIKIKGGENDVLLIGTVDCAEVQSKRKEYPKQLQKEIEDARNGIDNKKTEARKVKSPSAGFCNRKEEK
jgi:Reverse transcriptase (RNA-dependent DNA polymerase).